MDKQKKDKAEEILQTAAMGFNEKGYKAVSMDEIAKSLGISKKTIYLYFEGKEELLEKFLSNIIREAGLKLQVLKNRKVKTALLFHYVSILHEYLDQISPILKAEIKALYPHIYERISFFEQTLKTTLLYLVEGLNKKGKLLLSLPPRTVCELFFQQFLSLKAFSAAEVQFIVQAILKGLGSEKKKPVKEEKTKKKKKKQ